MPHLDDGQIAELLDAPDGASGSEPTLEAHLRDCAACRERVDEARAVAAEARRILAGAVPAGGGASVIPPFDEVLVRAGRAGPRRSRAVPWRGLAWAATVVMAVGVGWYARGEWVKPPPLGPVASLEQPADTPAASPDRPVPATVPAERPGAPPVREGLASEPTAQTERDEAAGAVGGRRAVAPADRLAAAPRQEVEAAPEAAARPAPATPPEDRARRQAETEVADRRVVGLVAPSAAKAAGADQVAVGVAWRAVSSSDAARLLGRPPLVVEQLPVHDVSILDAPDSLVRVRQILPDSAVLELLQWPERNAGMAEEVTREARADRPGVRLPPRTGNEAGVTVGGIRVVARAPLSEDSLRALLGKLR